jgi:SAM-dependent methyltransferase
MKPDDSLQTEGWRSVRALLERDQSLKHLASDSYLARPPEEEAQRYRSSAEFAAVRELLPGDPGLALEVGSGTGFLAAALASEGWRVIASDPEVSSEYGCQVVSAMARALRLPVRAVAQTAEAMACQSGAFDLVIARQTLHHAKSLPEFVSECARVTRPGGLVIFLREHVLRKPGDLQQFLDSHPLHHVTKDEGAFTLKEYLGAFQHADLTVEALLMPASSDINLAPRRQQDVGSHIMGRLRVPQKMRARLNRMAIRWMNRRPPSGALYSFVLGKPLDC